MKKSVGMCVVLAALLAAPAGQAADFGGPRYVPPAPPMSAGNPCYAVFHRRLDGQGLSLERLGPEEMPAIRRLRYENGRSLNGRVHSVTTGPAAVLVLYDRRHFRRLILEIGPGSRANLRLPVADSYELRCVAPPVYAPPAYAPPPGYK